MSLVGSSVTEVRFKRPGTKETGQKSYKAVGSASSEEWNHAVRKRTVAQMENVKSQINAIRKNTFKSAYFVS